MRYIIVAFVILQICSSGMATATIPEHENVKYSVAVMQIKIHGGMRQEDAATFINGLRCTLSRLDEYDVMEPDTMNGILEEKKFHNTKSGNYTKHLLDAGIILGVDRIIGIQIGLAGNVHAAFIRMVDVETGNVVVDVQEELHGEFESFLILTMPKLLKHFTTVDTTKEASN